jgi:hypothetical protein
MWWVGVVRAGRRMSYGGLDYLGLLIESWIAFFFGSTVHEEWSRRCTLRFGVHTRGETIVTSTAPYLGLPRAL